MRCHLADIRRLPPAVLRTAITRATAAALLIAGAGIATVHAQECFQDTDCDDGDVCNGIERCIGGSCSPSAPIPCDDGDPCTFDTCDPAIGCAHAEELCSTDCTGLADGTRCVDGSVCTVGDTCLGGACVPGPPPECPDAGPCTAATCDPVFGCFYLEQFVAPPCVAECTNTVADFTPCPGDGDICTLDACLPSVDFSDDTCIDGLLLRRQCADGDLCNGDEWCSPVLGCQANAPLVCNDGDPCNGEETCHAQLGCQPGTPLAEGTACDDGLLCTAADACAAGVCTGAPLGPADCDDTDPTTTDTCREGFGCLSCRALARTRVVVRVASNGKANGRLKTRAIAATTGVSLDPTNEAFSVIVDLDAAEIYRATIPAGAFEVRSKTVVRFRDKTAAVAGGIRSARIKDRGDERSVKSTSKGLSLSALSAGGATFVLVIGDDCFQATVSCTAGGSGRVVRCA